MEQLALPRGVSMPNHAIVLPICVAAAAAAGAAAVGAYSARANYSKIALLLASPPPSSCPPKHPHILRSWTWA